MIQLCIMTSIIIVGSILIGIGISILREDVPIPNNYPNYPYPLTFHNGKIETIQFNFENNTILPKEPISVAITFFGLPETHPNSTVIKITFLNTQVENLNDNPGIPKYENPIILKFLRNDSMGSTYTKDAYATFPQEGFYHAIISVDNVNSTLYNVIEVKSWDYYHSLYMAKNAEGMVYVVAGVSIISLITVVPVYSTVLLKFIKNKKSKKYLISEYFDSTSN